LKPFDVPKLRQIISGALKAARAMKQVVSYEPLLESEDYDQGIVGRSEPMQNVFKLIGQLAVSDATALITGESGTGKELVARAIYHHSKRSAHRFLAINCAAIPDNLLEAELFGHEKGAFTGATAQRIGKFEQCNGGTIFLDEIGDMSLATQTKILRVLQDGTFERVGGNQVVRVDVRVIAATNRNLEKAVAAREFREDLFYRLNVVRIQMPALRERREDIPLLINYFLKKMAQEQRQSPRAVAADAIKAMERHSWPGNVRELENAIRHALVVAKGGTILLQDLPPELSAPMAASAPGTAQPPTPPPLVSAGETDVSELARALFQWAKKDRQLKILPAVERELVIHALADTNGNQVQAAKLLGITRATLRKRVAKFNIKQELSIR
jgi:two-component system nitrogen regulation response regulator GlnG